MAAYFLLTMLKKPVHNSDIYHSRPTTKYFSKNSCKNCALLSFVIVIYYPFGIRGKCFTTPFIYLVISNFMSKSSGSWSLMYFRLWAIWGSTCSINSIVTLCWVIAIAIDISNSPPKGIDFLKEIARILPRKTNYYPIPRPDQPIINYRTIPPWSLPSSLWN